MPTIIQAIWVPPAWMASQLSPASAMNPAVATRPQPASAIRPATCAHDAPATPSRPNSPITAWL